MLKRSRLRNLFWYGSVGLLVLFAVAVSLLRLTISSAAEYRWKLEELAGNYLGQPIAISGMDARLSGLSPTIVLSDVVLLQEQSGAPLILFDSVAVSLDPIDSLLELAPIIELTINGASLEITRKADGSFLVEGLVQPDFNTPDSSTNEADSPPSEQTQVVGEWLLSQNRLAMVNSRIQLFNEKSGEHFRFDHVALELQNEGERHRLNGSVLLPKGIGKELRLSADITGDPLHGSDWEGDVYFKGAGLLPQQWEQELSWGESSIGGGKLSVDLWSEWQAGYPIAARAQVEVENLTLVRGELREQFQQLSSDARFEKEPQGWRLEIDKLTVQQQGLPLLNSRFEVRQEGSRLGLKAQQLSMKTIASLLPFLPMLDEKAQAMVRQMAPTGQVHELRLWRDGEEAIVGQGRVEQLAMQAWQKLPGLQGVSGRFQFDGANGYLELDSRDAVVELPTLFRDPLPLNHLSGALHLNREADGWQLISDHLELMNNDIALQLAMELRLAEQMPPWLSIQGKFRDGEAPTTPRYLPTSIMHSGTVSWLDKAFVAGRVPRGTMQVHGFVHEFPFRGPQGRFEVLFEVDDVQLHYQDRWPDLTQLAAEVHFDDGGLRIAAKEARLFEARVGETSVTIENFIQPQLMVDATAAFALQDGLRFLRESPLVAEDNETLAKMRGLGDSALALKLAIPLSQVMKEREPLSVAGLVTFTDNQLAVTEGVELKAINGQLQFSESQFEAEEISAQLYRHPTTIRVSTQNGAQKWVVLDVQGRADMATLGDAFEIQVFDYLEGETDWQAELSLPYGKADSGTKLNIQSNLTGVSSKLPHPLNKAKNTRKHLQLDLYLNGQRQGERRLSYGGELGAVWRHKGEQLQQAQLRLGGSRPLTLPQRSVIEVVGHAENISMAKWHRILGAMEKQQKNKNSPPLLINMDALSLVGDIEAESFNGKTRAADFPNMSFNAKQFRYDDYALGEVAIKLHPKDKAVVLEDIQVKSDIYSLAAYGSWVEGANTSLDLTLNSLSMEKLLKQFGFATVIKDGSLKLNGKLWWPGVPAAFSLPKLSGEMEVVVKDGTIVDVEPGAGRMLGILSVPALPRRLFLDFSDILKEGFAFNRIKGNIRLDKGQAYTSNLKLESIPASILVSGRTGLVAQDMDQDVYVVPNVSDTVSVASALAWGPQVAAAVVLLQEVFQKDINKATMVQYHVSGSWDKPVIKRIERKSEAGEESSDEGLFGE